VIPQGFGDRAGFLGMTAAGLMTVGLLCAFMPETKPQPFRRRPLLASLERAQKNS